MIEIYNTSNDIDFHTILHQHAHELAYETIPEMFIPAKMIFLDGSINDMPVKIMLDTGATCTVISSDAVNRIGIDDYVDPLATVEMHGIGCERSPGTIWMVELNLNNNICPIMLTVSNSKFHNFDIILGIDFMRSYKAVINFCTNTLMLNNKYSIQF